MDPARADQGCPPQLENGALGKCGGVHDMGSLFYTDLLPFSRDSAPATREFLERALDLLLGFIMQTYDRRSKILDFHYPDQLKDVIDLEIPLKALSLEQILKDCEDTMKYQVKTGHPRFFNQLTTGLDLVCMVGEWLTATASTNMFTYEIAPVFILMEQVTFQHMREIIGWPGGKGDSTFAPGGSVANMYSVMAARHKMFPRCKREGALVYPQLVMFTSEDCHYSLMGAAAAMGIGTENCVLVPVDGRGKMIPEELERAILESRKAGKAPFYVNATSGTTVLGAFDPIDEVADICEKYGLWLHVDAAWGGGLLFSRKHRKLRFHGIDRADSVVWNPHKLMGALLQCSTVHFKEDGLLLSCNNMCANYLFQPDKHYDINYDTGDKVIQCGRHNDVFKLWLMWRAKGDEGFERQVDRFMELTEYMVRRLREHPDKFELLLEQPECVNVSFWYVPRRLRGMPSGAQRTKLLGEVCPLLKQRMMEAGTLMISYQPLREHPNFFRNIISNQAVSEKDVDFILSEMDRLGHDL